MNLQKRLLDTQTEWTRLARLGGVAKGPEQMCREAILGLLGGFA